MFMFAIVTIKSSDKLPLHAPLWHVPHVGYTITNLAKTFYLILAEKLNRQIYVLIMLRGRILINRLLVKQACYTLLLLLVLLLCATKRCNRSCAKFEGKQST